MLPLGFRFWCASDIPDGSDVDVELIAAAMYPVSLEGLLPLSMLMYPLEVTYTRVTG